MDRWEGPEPAEGSQSESTTHGRADRILSRGDGPRGVGENHCRENGRAASCRQSGRAGVTTGRRNEFWGIGGLRLGRSPLPGPLRGVGRLAHRLRYPRSMVLIPDWFRAEWERDRERREIAELEEFARMLLALQSGVRR